MTLVKILSFLMGSFLGTLNNSITRNRLFSSVQTRVGGQHHLGPISELAALASYTDFKKCCSLTPSTPLQSEGLSMFKKVFTKGLVEKIESQT